MCTPNPPLSLSLSVSFSLSLFWRKSWIAIGSTAMAGKREAWKKSCSQQKKLEKHASDLWRKLFYTLFHRCPNAFRLSHRAHSLHITCREFIAHFYVKHIFIMITATSDVDALANSIVCSRLPRTEYACQMRCSKHETRDRDVFIENEQINLSRWLLNVQLFALFIYSVYFSFSVIACDVHIAVNADVETKLRWRLTLDFFPTTS